MRRMSGRDRLARVLALLAMLLSQPLAAIHAATDEAHLAASHVATDHGGRVSTIGAGERHGDHSHSKAVHLQACDVCLLVGSALSTAGQGRASDASAWTAVAAPIAHQAVTTEKRLRAGDPVRAPPRVHLI